MTKSDFAGIIVMRMCCHIDMSGCAVVHLGYRCAVPAIDAASDRFSFSLLESLAKAIDTFWAETVYIYNESIEHKHESLETQLAQERGKRAGRDRPWDPPA